MTSPPSTASTVPLDEQGPNISRRPTARTRVPRLRAFIAGLGPSLMISVGYIDPGNWATDIAAGSAFGHLLLPILLMSSLMAMILQAVAIRLGVGGGMDLAQACRARYGRAVNLALWAAAEVSMVACDIAEVIGSAIALQILFGLPLPFGVVATGADVLLLISLQKRGIGALQAGVGGLVGLIAICLAIELALSHLGLSQFLSGFNAGRRELADPQLLYLAVGIVGATVMPHNLYLHSHLVRSQKTVSRTERGRRLRNASTSSVTALSFAALINVSILVLAATDFHARGFHAVSDLGAAAQLLTPTLGSGLAGILFAVALLAAGQSSTITATLAGQIVMEGHAGIKISAPLRRLATRSAAIVPALGAALVFGSAGVDKLLVFSQVILSLQLPCAAFPLIAAVRDRKLMGKMRARRSAVAVASAVAIAITVLNGLLIVRLLTT